jgi:hypothetical protein
MQLLNRTLLPSLEDEELAGLAIDALAARMDQILETNYLERYGADHLDSWPVDAKQWLRPRPGMLVATTTFATFTSERQRRVLQRFFATLVQTELTYATLGLMNQAVFDEQYDGGESLRSPATRITMSALEQYTVISSRIIVENLLDLIHDLGTGQPLPTDVRSRLKTFRNWLVRSAGSNPYVY